MHGHLPWSGYKRERERETERQRDRETERQRETERDRDRQTDRQTETERQRLRQRQRQRQRETDLLTYPSFPSLKRGSLSWAWTPITILFQPLEYRKLLIGVDVYNDFALGIYKLEGFNQPTVGPGLVPIVRKGEALESLGACSALAPSVKGRI